MPMKTAQLVLVMMSGWSISPSQRRNWFNSPSGFRMPIHA